MYTHFIPSFYGDIRVIDIDSHWCGLVTEKVTIVEKQVLGSLEVTARKKGWINTKDSLLGREGEVKLHAPLKKVVAEITKLLKPTRKLVSAVRIANGKIEEIHEQSFNEPKSIAALTPYRERVEVLPRAAVATTVAVPTIGCPAPDFVKAELKAREVLEHFLDPQQIADFQHYNRFISTSFIGHRYMITSRHARSELANYRRSLYDLDEHRPICAHDWSVPAAEEMLAFHVLLQLPGYEDHLRRLS